MAEQRTFNPMVRGSIPRRPTEFSQVLARFASLWRLATLKFSDDALPISDRCSQVRESGDVVATKVERHRADVREVEADSALAEPGRDDIDESNIGKGELGEQTTRKRRAAGVDDKEPTTGHNERAIVTVRSVNTLAYLARWTLRSLRGGGERKNGNHDLPRAQPVTHSLENLRPLFGVLRM